MEDFFGSKNIMNFVGIATLSLGIINLPDDTFEIEIEINEDNYKKIIHKNGKIYVAIIQGDLSYAGILTQLIKEKIDISKVKKSLFDIDYSDFFNIKENLEYTYKCKKSILNIEWIFCIYDFKRRINGIYEIR